MVSPERVYFELFEFFGPQGWWPLFKSRGAESPRAPLYFQGLPSLEEERFEIALGAVLTQSTSWKSVEKALYQLNFSGCLSPSAIVSLSQKDLETLIRPAGYYRQKAERIKRLAELWPSLDRRASFQKMRSRWLSVKGVGEETADSVLLYAYDQPTFVVDAYTKRIFQRLGEDQGKRYENWKKWFEKNLPKQSALFREYHALLVRLGKEICQKKKPRCKICPLSSFCLRRFT